MCLITLLYAGTNIKIYKYSVFIKIYKYFVFIKTIVKKLYIWFYQQETLIFFKGSLETTRNDISKNLISVHTPTKLKPLNSNQLGYYLAGLIDGDGHFDNQKGYLTIVYDSKDISAAYWLKSQIGYGSVSSIKNKNSVIYVISHSDGLFKVLELINNKLKTNNKYNQIINNLLKNNELVNSKFYSNYKSFNKGDISDFNNYWLAGFIDSNGSLQIKILNRVNRIKPEIRLKLQIVQTDLEILQYIKLYLCNSNNINDINNLKGCYIGTRKHSNNLTSYYLETTSYSLSKRVISYLDKYQLISYKYLNYIYFRKIYLLIQDKRHLTEDGINQIKIMKNKMRYKI